MSKPTFVPGQGFPARLRALLMRKNMRVKRIEAQGVMSADALHRWLNGAVYPEKQTYFNLCSHLKLSSAEGWNLLRNEGEPALVIAGKEAQRLARFLQSCESLEILIPALTEEQATRLGQRLRALARTAEEQKKQWQASTTTPSAAAS